MYKPRWYNWILTILWSPLFVPIGIVGRFIRWLIPVPRSKFRLGAFAPISDEPRMIRHLTFQGQIPPLKGKFCKIGPNPQDDDQAYHWFDGDGYMYALDLASMTFMSHQLQTDRYVEERRIGTVYYKIGWTFNLLVFPFKASWKLLKLFLGYARLIPITKQGAANTSIEIYDGKTLALHEMALPFEVSIKETLKSIGYYNFNGQLKHNMTAHPKIIDGEIRIIGYDFISSNYVSYSIFKGKELLSSMKVTRKHMKYPVMMHDFGATKNYSLLLDFPMAFDWTRIPLLQSPISYRTDVEARVGIFPKYASNANDIIWFKVESCFLLHLFNCFENGDDEIVMRGCPIKGGFDLETFATSQPSVPYEWTFNLKTKEVKERVIYSEFPGNTDFPTIRPDLTGLPHRYGYACLFGKSPEDKDKITYRSLGVANSIVKIDFNTNEKIVVPLDGIGGEPIFVPNGEREDQGYVMVWVHYTSETKLWIMEATEMQVVCKITVPMRLPVGFHCKWVPQ